jgi:diacylglycerol kinase family enzyme
MPSTAPVAPRVVVLLNAGARSDSALARRDEIEHAFASRGVDAQVVVVEGVRVRRAVRRMLREPYDVIVAAGGDGTVSGVAVELADTGVQLGVLPLGTLNHFARDLGIPLELDAAVGVVCEGEAQPVDIGRINGHGFVNNVSLGLYPDQVRLRQTLKKRLGKWPAAFVAAARVLWRFRSLWITVELDGERMRRRCPMVMVGNNRYCLAGGRVTNRECLDAGILSVYLLSVGRRLGVVRAFVWGLFGAAEKLSGFETLLGPTAVIHVHRRHVRVAIDGEFHRMRSPLRCSTRAGALLVRRPRPASAPEA